MWWAPLILLIIPFAGLCAWLEGKLEQRFPAAPPYAPHGEPGRTIPFCACSRGSQRLGMHW